MPVWWPTLTCNRREAPTHRPFPPGRWDPTTETSGNNTSPTVSRTRPSLVSRLLFWGNRDDPGIIQRTSLSQLDQTNDTKRLAGRHPNLVNLLPLQNKAEVVEKRTAPQYPDEVSLQKLIVKVLKVGGLSSALSSSPDGNTALLRANLRLYRNLRREGEEKSLGNVPF